MSYTPQNNNNPLLRASNNPYGGQEEQKNNHYTDVANNVGGAGQPRNVFAGHEEQKTVPCCEEAQVEVKTAPACAIFVANICYGGVGTFFSAFMDERGFNQWALGLGIAQAYLTYAFYIGWFWSVWHGYCVLQHAQNREVQKERDASSEYQQV